MKVELVDGFALVDNAKGYWKKTEIGFEDRSFGTRFFWLKNQKKIAQETEKLQKEVQKRPENTPKHVYLQGFGYQKRMSEY